MRDTEERFDIERCEFPCLIGLFEDRRGQFAIYLALDKSSTAEVILQNKDGYLDALTCMAQDYAQDDVRMLAVKHMAGPSGWGHTQIVPGVAERRSMAT